MAVRLQRARDRLTVFWKTSLQITFHQAKPICVGRYLVLGIDRDDRILEIDDGRQCGFHDHVGQSESIVLADRVVSIDHQLKMQSVVLQQYRGWRGGFAAICLEAIGH